ncbi:TRAP transporter large permease [Roseomonas sp. SSH11]|uniref:TRAP transporter large permease protein n=1 Tax=Pararoseomonas baculiformis TaxID=2820812 RepID=A0ABS4A851_9PROT|nr:TRAP transporter large permease [Pararoseomonas baculiformis]MBP0443180.1 TRAP transporter large permease [Pararoseomonas baculiformis]
MLEGSAILLVAFFALLFLGAPIGVALGASGILVIAIEGLGVMALPTNVWTGIAKYPLLALPMFVLAGMVFERSGVAQRLVDFASALVGPRRGGLAIVAVLVCLVLGGISGSGAADAAAVAAVMLPPMLRQGYPRPFTASLVAAAGSTAVLIPPSIPFIVYAVLIPGVSVPALFMGGVVPGILAGLSLILPAIWLARRGNFGLPAPDEARIPLWQAFKGAIWGLAAPVVILGGLRSGAFTPTEAAVVAVFYGLFVGLVIYRTLTWRDVYAVLRDSAEVSAVVLIIIALATIFAHAGSTIGAFDALAGSLIGLTDNATIMLLLITVMILLAGTLIDAISVFLVFLPILLPIATAFGWDLTWFGVILTMNVAIGAFTPPMAVNLMITCRVAGCSMESTLPWVIWFVGAMLGALLLVTFVPELVLFLPRLTGAL